MVLFTFSVGLKPVLQKNFSILEIFVENWWVSYVDRIQWSECSENQSWQIWLMDHIYWWPQDKGNIPIY